MKALEIIPKHFYSIPTCFTTKLFISFEQSYSIIEEFLIDQEIEGSEIYDYIELGEKGKHIQARTKLFFNNDLILIKINYFDNNIRSISILQHEIIHAAKKILYMYKYYKEQELDDEEEAECYLSEYIFEEIMLMLKTDINYKREYRNMSWLYEITHKLKKEDI